MSYRFGGAPQPGLSLRDRMFVVGGTAITLAALALISIVIYSRTDVKAKDDVRVVNEQNARELTLGSVILLTPASEVPEGSKLSGFTMKEIPWRRNEVPEGAVRRGDDISSMYAKVTLRPNEPVLRANLSPTPLLGGLVDLLPPGHRAVTIEVDSTSGVEGWARPGVHVDVLVTYRDQEDSKTKTQIAIEDAVVLSYNGETKVTGRSETVSRITKTGTVTLAVPVIAALKLQNAVAMGRVSLMLRSTGDLKSVGTQIVSTDDFKSGAGEPEQAKLDAASQGYVRYTDPHGVTRELELRKGKHWYEVGETGQ